MVLIRELALIHDREDQVVDKINGLYSLLSSEQGFKYSRVFIVDKGFREIYKLVSRTDLDIVHAYMDLGILVKLLIAMIISCKPRLLIITVPSNYRLSRLKAYLLTSLLNMLCLLGKKVLVSYLSPYEPYVLNKYLGRFKYMYIPFTLFCKVPGKTFELLTSEPLTILYPVYHGIDYSVSRVISLLKDVGMTPRFIFFGKLCIDNPYTLCIYSEEYSDYIRGVSIGLVLDNSVEANMRLTELVMHGKPVITLEDNPFSYQFIDTGFIKHIESSDTDTILTAIIDIVNRIDDYKKILAIYKPEIPDNRNIALYIYKEIISTLLE